MAQVHTKKLVQLIKKHNIILEKNLIVIPLLYEGKKYDPIKKDEGGMCWYEIPTLRQGWQFYMKLGLKITRDENKNFLINIYTFVKSLGNYKRSENVYRFTVNKKTGKMMEALDLRRDSRAVYFRAGYQEYVDERPMDLLEATDRLNLIIKNRL